MHAYRFRRLSRLARRSDPHNSYIKVSKFMRKDICFDNNDDESSQCSVVHIIVVRSGGHRLIRCGRNAFSFLFFIPTRLVSFYFIATISLWISICVCCKWRVSSIATNFVITYASMQYAVVADQIIINCLDDSTRFHIWKWHIDLITFVLLDYSPQNNGNEK